jgi:N-acetylmuramoyl-L-alanine amidase
VPAIIRGIYAYHVNVRGWRDIGYNFLVDRFGRIWEGRYGGIDQAVIGAHTAGYNSNAFAMSVLGTYTAKEPEPAVIEAYKKLFVWKFSLHGVVPSVSVPYPDGKNLQPVAGHRDAAATECPGELLYDWVPNIRAGTTALMGDIPATRQSRITVTGPESAPDGTAIPLRVWWAAGGWVTGTVHLQRWNSCSWQYVKQVKVVNGRAGVRTVLNQTRTYRVLGRYAPGVILPTSAAVTVRAE